MRHFVVTLTFVSGGPSPEATKAQVAFLNKLYEQGVLMFSGKFVDGRNGMAVLRADSLEEVQELYQESPIIRDGGATFDVREWHIAFGLTQR